MIDPARERLGRFQDTGRGESILEGYQDVAREDPLDKQFIQRNLRRYKKFGVPTRLGKLKGMSDAELERMAAIAVLKRRGVDYKPLREKVNRSRYTPRQLRKARAAITAGRSGGKALRPVVRHIRQIRRNRRVNATRIWKGRGYDISKGYDLIK